MHPTWSTARHPDSESRGELLQAHYFCWWHPITTASLNSLTLAQANHAKGETELAFTGRCSHYCRFSGRRIALLVFSKLPAYGVKQPVIFSVTNSSHAQRFFNWERCPREWQVSYWDQSAVIKQEFIVKQHACVHWDSHNDWRLLVNAKSFLFGPNLPCFR